MDKITLLKLKYLLPSLSFLFYFLAPSLTYAAAPDSSTLCPTSFDGKLCKSSDAGVFIANIISYLLITGAILAVIIIAVGGIKWITAGGDKTKVATAREMVIGAIIGLIVTFSAYFIVDVVLKTFFGFDIGGGFKLPTLI